MSSGSLVAANETLPPLKAKPAQQINTSPLHNRFDRCRRLRRNINSLVYFASLLQLEAADLQYVRRRAKVLQALVLASRIEGLLWTFNGKLPNLFFHSTQYLYVHLHHRAENLCREWNPQFLQQLQSLII